MRTLFINLLLIIFLINCTNVKGQAVTSEYREELKKAWALFTFNQELTDDVLVKLVPNNYGEFALYFNTTVIGNEFYSVDFFEKTSNQIFEKAVNDENKMFYEISIKLASFSDAEYQNELFAEDFIYYLEKLIEMNISKFCKTVKNKEYSNIYRIKYYVELYNCK